MKQIGTKKKDQPSEGTVKIHCDMGTAFQAVSMIDDVFPIIHIPWDTCVFPGDALINFAFVMDDWTNVGR